MNYRCIEKGFSIGEIPIIFIDRHAWSSKDVQKDSQGCGYNSMEAQNRLYMQEGLWAGGEMVNQFWAFICETGFFGWVGCTIGLIFRAFGPDDAFFGRRAAFWGSLIVVFYAIWVLGMMKA